MCIRKYRGSWKCCQYNHENKMKVVSIDKFYIYVYTSMSYLRRWKMHISCMATPSSHTMIIPEERNDRHRPRISGTRRCQRNQHYYPAMRHEKCSTTVCARYRSSHCRYTGQRTLPREERFDGRRSVEENLCNSHDGVRDRAECSSGAWPSLVVHV